MARNRQQILQRIYLVSASLFEVMAGIVLMLAIPLLNLHYRIIYLLGYILFDIDTAMLLTYLLFYLFVCHHLHKGFRYAGRHITMTRNLREHLKDAGYFKERNFRGEKTAVLPRIRIIFDKSLETGTIYIQNNIRQDKRLEDVDISSALGRYIITEQYLSKNANYYIYEFEDASTDFHLTFCQYKEFSAYAKQAGDYTLFMDKRTCIPLSHMLLVGVTGSGKSYSLYSMVLAMLNWDIKAVLFFADPKNSSLAVLGNRISPENTAGEIESIISLLEKFYRKMEDRKVLLQKKLQKKLDADYRSFQMPAHVFIFDEFASFSAVLATLDTATRKKVDSMLQAIVLQGRQLGFILIVAMQKSSAESIRTDIRSNLLCKVVLGRADRTTYLTAFEDSAKDVKASDFEQGEGLYYYPGITRSPKRMSFPTLDFDILKSVGEKPGVL